MQRIYSRENIEKMTAQFIASRDYVRKNEKSLREKYQGRMYIAILNKTIIDSDADVRSLWHRVCEKPTNEGDFDKIPVIGSINSILADTSFLEKILFEFGGIF